MNTFTNIEQIFPFYNPVVTIGSYDGLHIGHSTIINQLKKLAKELNGETVLITFDPHPRTLIYPNERDFKLIYTLSEKIEIIKQYQLDNIIIIPFTIEFSKIPFDSFIKNVIIQKINAKKLVVGANHQFGNKRKGNVSNLIELSHLYNFEVIEVSPVTVEDKTISSTLIRKTLFDGKIDLANKYLGREFCITGKIMPGSKLGTKLGFPTANIFIEDNNKIIPGIGVYAVNVMHKNNYYKGMLYIGHRPTINGKNLSIEVHIFNFKQNIYFDNVTVFFKHFIRNEHSFSSLDELQKQLNKDKAIAMSIL